MGDPREHPGLIRNGIQEESLALRGVSARCCRPTTARSRARQAVRQRFSKTIPGATLRDLNAVVTGALRTTRSSMVPEADHRHPCGERGNRSAARLRIRATRPPRFPRSRRRRRPGGADSPWWTGSPRNGPPTREHPRLVRDAPGPLAGCPPNWTRGQAAALTLQGSWPGSLVEITPDEPHHVHAISRRSSISDSFTSWIPSCLAQGVNPQRSGRQLTGYPDSMRSAASFSKSPNRAADRHLRTEGHRPPALGHLLDEALGLEKRREMPIRDEALNIFMGVPGEELPELEPTHNHGVHDYELGHRLRSRCACGGRP